MEAMTTELPMWTIYERPRDYPQGYVVRRCTVTDGHVVHDRVATFHKTLAEARQSLREGLVCLSRDENDDPVIVEVWV